MKKDSPGLPERYGAALRAYLDRPRIGGTAPARTLGRELIAAGLNAPGLVRLHERSLAALVASRAVAAAHRSPGGRAGKFLAAALAPVAAAHRASQSSVAHLRQRAATLRLHRAALAQSNRRLQREVVRRRAGEAAVKTADAQNRDLLAQSQVMQKKLRQLTRQILSAQEDERRRISRDLHDEVAQTLLGINVELAALGRTGPLGRRALQTRLARTQRLVAKSVAAVHQFARDLRPAVLDHLGLIPALRIFMERLSARKKLILNLTAFAGVEALDNARLTVLYRVAQEALTNVARHARASTVNMTIGEIPGAIRMEVNDDGKSFPVLKALSSKTHRRLGLLGMRERVEMVGGTLTIESVPGQGTSVRVELPFSPGGAA
jgi:signal transduction histidine kinase